MKLSEFTKKYKNSNTFLKKEFKKNGYELYHFNVKNKNNIDYRNFLIAVDKKKNIVANASLKEKEVLRAIIQFKKELRSKFQTLKYNKVLSNSEDIKKSKIIKKTKSKITKEAEKINKKRKSLVSYKSEKEKKDALYLYFTYTFLKLYLESTKIAKNEKGKFILISNDRIDKKLYNLLMEIGSKLYHIGVSDDSVKGELIEIQKKSLYDKIQNEIGVKDVYYLACVLFLLKEWKESVNYKKIFFILDNEIINEYFEFNFDYFYKIDKDILNNSELVAYKILEKIYGIKRMTKQDREKLFSKFKKENK